MSRNKTEKDCISYCKWRLFALSSPASRWRVWPTHSFSCKCPFKGYLSNFLPTTLLQSTSPPAQRLPRVLLYTRAFQLIHCSNLTHFSLNYLFIYIYLSSREGPAWVKLKAARTRMELVRECMNMREGWPLNLTKLFKGQKIGSYLLSWTLSRVFATRLCQNNIFLPELLMRWSFGICSCRCASGRDSASLSGNVAIKAFLTPTEHTLQQLHECRWNLRPAQMSKKKEKCQKSLCWTFMQKYS